MKQNLRVVAVKKLCHMTQRKGIFHLIGAIATLKEQSICYATHVALKELMRLIYPLFYVKGLLRRESFLMGASSGG